MSDDLDANRSILHSSQQAANRAKSAGLWYTARERVELIMSSDPETWFMSAVGDPEDYTYSPIQGKWRNVEFVDHRFTELPEPDVTVEKPNA